MRIGGSGEVCLGIGATYDMVNPMVSKILPDGNVIVFFHGDEVLAKLNVLVVAQHYLRIIVGGIAFPVLVSHKGLHVVCVISSCVLKVFVIVIAAVHLWICRGILSRDIKLHGVVFIVLCRILFHFRGVVVIVYIPTTTVGSLARIGSRFILGGYITCQWTLLAI